MGYLPTGTVLLDRFEILSEIGRGGYSVVYRARDRQLEAEVAIKLLVPPPAVALLARERMRREVLAARRLSHANIVAVHDIADEGPWTFMVMEYVAGPDLAVRIRERGPLAAAPVAQLGQEIASALSAGHRHGVLHRDVKPQNILLDPDGRARLTDFGSARLDGQATVTATGSAVGTLDYMAPEVFRGQRGDARSDLYSLGLTLYFGLTGRLPARGSPHLPPSPLPHGFHPSLIRSDVPAWLDRAIARMTAARPADRYPSGAVAGEALNSDSELPTPSPPPDAGALDFCLLCGVDDPLGLGLCPACGATIPEGQCVHVLLHPPLSAAERIDRRDRVRKLLGLSVDSSTIREVVEGRRVLMRVPLAGAERIVERLSNRGLPMRTAVGRWAPLPHGIAWVAGSMVLSGIAAGLVTAPLLIWLSPCLAGLVVVEAGRRATRPALSPPVSRMPLTPEVGRILAQAFADLPEGTALELLGEIARNVHGLKLRLESGGMDQSGADAAEELLVHACAAARDLADVEIHLSSLESQRDRFGSNLERWAENLSDTERIRDRLVQRMLDALAALGRTRTRALQTSGLQQGSIEEVSAELEREVKAYAEAVREVTDLVAAREEVTAIP